MSEPDEVTAVSGEIVKRGEVERTPPPADMRYEDDSCVTRVFVRVEWASGKIREYQARNPEGFEMNDPESARMSFRPTGTSFSAGGRFVPQVGAVPSLRLNVTPNARDNLHIRTEWTAPEDFPGITYG